MPVRGVVALLALVHTAAAAPAFGQATLTVYGDPGPLVVSTATAGSPPDPGVDNSTSYDLSTDQVTARITAELSAPMPAGTTLRVRFEAPAGATSNGFVALSTTPREVVGSILPGNYAGLAITYELEATTAGGPVPWSSCTVTFTVEAGP